MPNYDEELNELDNWIRRLKVEYDIFFNGHRKRAPEDLKARVERVITKMSEAANMSYAQRFRYSTLITRYYVFRDKWRRTLQARELGETAKEEATARAGTPVQYITLGKEGVRVSITDPEKEEDKVRLLYDFLLKTQAKQDTPSLTYQQFSTYIANKTRNIKEKHGCPSVEFNVWLEEDRIKFIARAAETP